MRAAPEPQGPRPSSPDVGDLLPAYLDAAGRRAWSWDAFNCLFYIADWIACLHGCDPAAAFRGAFAGQRQARALMRRAGGIEAIVGRALAGVGFGATATPRAGDVGLVWILILRRDASRAIAVPSGAICARGGPVPLWAIKPRDARSLLVQSFPLVRAWAITPSSLS